MHISPVSIFKSLSDATRLRCVTLLLKNSELCVCELTHALDLPQPKISHHLATLRKAGLVADRKQGLWIYYRINPELPGWVVQALHCTVDGVFHEDPFKSDAATLDAMQSSDDGLCNP